MKNKNPIFSRLDEQSANGGAGFAYQEGLTAYQTAGHEAPGQQGMSAYAPPPATALGRPTGSVYEPVSDRMTLDDVLVKTGISMAVLIPMAAVGWMLMPTSPWLVWIAAMAGFGLGLANTFKKVVSPPLILAYAATQGLFLGGISWFYTEWAAVQGFEGNLVGQAILGTLVAFVVMLALYKSRIVKVDGRFMKMMMVAMVSYLVIALISMVSAMFGLNGGWGFYGAGNLGIILCLAGVALAAFSLMIDFESITQGVRLGLPERESWRMAFGLLVTLIWLYLEILRLLALLAANRD